MLWGRHKLVLNPSRITPAIGSLEIANRNRLSPLPVVEFLLLCMIIRFIGRLRAHYFARFGIVGIIFYALHRQQQLCVCLLCLLA
ncbi:hypothetical protein ES703_106791 [subsurface metagenome]